MVKNVTNLTIMNEDLHVFIPQDLIPLGQSEHTPSFEQFVFTIQDNLGVKIQNLKVDFKTRGTWRRVGQ